MIELTLIRNQLTIAIQGRARLPLFERLSECRVSWLSESSLNADDGNHPEIERISFDREEKEIP